MKEPKSADIEDYLQSRLPTFMQLSAIETKSFAGVEAGSGRTSAAVTLTLAEPVYRSATEQELNAELARHDLSLTDVAKYSPTAHGYDGWHPPIYVLSWAKGSTFTTAADLQYREEVTGWQFDGTIDTSKIQGELISEMPSNAVVEGSPEFESIFKAY